LGPVASRLPGGMLAAGAVALAAVSLPGYYADPAARDNYAGVARLIGALGNATDLVILNAPGQQEVWGYYDPGLPVLALPQERPPDPVQTVETVAQTVAGRRYVYALFWATDEADPDGLVEGWLNQHLFKGLESWQGNLRFVMYTTPGTLTYHSLSPPISFGEAIVLLGSDQAPSQQAAPGEVAPITLHWEASQPITTRYKVAVQLLDERNQVTAQHDSEPGGGAAPTDSWQPGNRYLDRHGVFIPPGTPPGRYRMIVALYNPATGERLPTPHGDAFTIGEVEILSRLQPVPLDIVPIQQRVERRLWPVTLAGYDLYRTGFAHAPATPLHAGDLVHVTLYWQAPDPLPPDWPADLTFQLQLGPETITAPLAGGRYPTGEWRAGELVRGEFDMRYDGASRRPLLLVGNEQIRLAPLPR
jgi:mannosyltransferase